MGAASADALYGAIASFGLTFVTQFLVGQQLWIRLIGGCFLVYLGLKTLWSRPIERTVSMEKRSLFGAYTSTFLLTLTTMLTFVGVFAGVGLGAQTTRSYALAAVLVLGVFLGSALWWLLLSTGVGALRVRFNAPLRWVNRISGGVLVVFGVLALLSLVSR
jgi:threonine/homoserine/homoserine lactone efflux protein